MTDMKCCSREVEGVVLVDCIGWLPDSIEESDQLAVYIRTDLCDKDILVFVAHDVEFTGDFSVGLGLLMRAFTEGGIRIGGLGVPPFVHIVSTSERFLSILNVTDSPLIGFATEEGAIASVLHKK